MGSFQRNKIERMLFQDFNLYYYFFFKCPLRIASYALRIGVSVIELYGSEILIAIHFYCAYWNVFITVCPFRGNDPI